MKKLKNIRSGSMDKFLKAYIAQDRANTKMVQCIKTLSMDELKNFNVPELSGHIQNMIENEIESRNE